MTIDINEKIRIMQAFKDGKQVQVKPISQGIWQHAKDPAWNWHSYDYRVTPPGEQLPNKRLIRVSELPFPCLISQRNSDIVFLVTTWCLKTDTLYANEKWYSPGGLKHEDYVFSKEGRDWFEFDVEEHIKNAPRLVGIKYIPAELTR